MAGKFQPYSPYNYVLGNPISLVDPDGRMATGPDDPPSSNSLISKVKNAANRLYNLVANAGRDDAPWQGTTEAYLETNLKLSLGIQAGGTIGTPLEQAKIEGNLTSATIAEVGTSGTEYKGSMYSGPDGKTEFEDGFALEMNGGIKGTDASIGVSVEVEETWIQDVETGRMTRESFSGKGAINAFGLSHGYKQTGSSNNSVEERRVGISVGFKLIVGVEAEIELVLPADQSKK